MTKDSIIHVWLTFLIEEELTIIIAVVRRVFLGHMKHNEARDEFFSLCHTNDPKNRIFRFQRMIILQLKVIVTQRAFQNAQRYVTLLAELAEPHHDAHGSFRILAVQTQALIEPVAELEERFEFVGFQPREDDLVELAFESIRGNCSPVNITESDDSQFS